MLPIMRQILMGKQVSDAIAVLAKAAGAVCYLDARKVSGGKPGKNNPLITVFDDLSGNGNAMTLSDLAGTSADGYVVSDGLHFLRVDGVNTRGSIANSSSLHVTTEDFAFCWAGIPESYGFLFMKGEGSSSDNVQYGMRIENDDSASVYLNGYGGYQKTGAGTITLNQFVRIDVIRVDGAIKIFIDGELSRDKPDSTTFSVDRPDFGLFNKPGDATFVAAYFAYLAIFKGTNVTESSIGNFSTKASEGYL